MSIFEYDQEKHFRMIAKENQELGFIKAMASLVNDGVLTVADAAARSSMSETEFLREAEDYLTLYK